MQGLETPACTPHALKLIIASTIDQRHQCLPDEDEQKRDQKQGNTDGIVGSQGYRCGNQCDYRAP